MPFAEDEIRKLATDKLQDAKAVDKLMDAVQRAMEDRANKFPIGAPNPKEKIDEPMAIAKVTEKPVVQVPVPVESDDAINIPPSQPPRSRAWILIPIAALIGLGTALYFVMRKKRARPGQ